MKRVYSIDEIKSIISSEGYIDLFFYKGFCDYSNQIYRLFLSHKHIDIHILSYKIFDTLTVQFDVDMVPSIIRLTSDGISNRYTGKSQISEYILCNEKKIESQIIKEIHKEQSTQTSETRDILNTTDDTSYSSARYIITESSDSDDLTI